jgi:WD40 repeat protein
MKFRFNPYRLLIPTDSLAADETPANAPEGASNLQADEETASTPTTSAPPVNHASHLINASQVDDASSAPSVMESLTLSTITTPTARHESLQLPPARILDTIGTNSGNVSRVATTTSNDSRINRVVFGSSDGKIYFFEPTPTESDDANSDDSDSSPSLVPFQGPESEVTSLVFSLDSTKLLVTWSSGKVMAFDARDGKKIHECQTPDDLRDCAFSKDGKRVVIGGGKHGWKMFDFNNFPSKIESNEFNPPPGGGEVRSVNFSHDDTKLAIGVFGGGARGCYIFNADGTGEPLCTFGKGDLVFKVVFSPNSMTIAVGCCGKVYLFNVATGECLHTFSMKAVCWDIQFSIERHRIFFGTYRGGMAYGYDVYNGALEFKIKCSDNVGSIALLNDETLLAAGGDAHCKVINIAVRPTHQVEHDEEVCDCAISPNGELIVFAYRDKGFKVCKTYNNELVSENIEDTTAYSVCFSPSGNKIACVDGKNISIYNVEDGTKERTIATPDDFLSSRIEFWEDEQHIIRIRREGEIAYIFNIDKKEEDPLSIPTSAKILDACPVPQKNLLAIATEEEISFHNVTDGQIKNKFIFQLNTKKDGTLQAMEFTSDGSRMVLCSDTHLNTYKFHSNHGVDTSSKVSTILPPLQEDEANLAVRCMTVSGDDKIVAVCDTNHHIYTFSLDDGGNERDVVHKFSMHTEIITMHFLSVLSTEGHYPLVLSYSGEKKRATTTLEVSAKEGVIDPSLLFRSLDVCNDDIMLALIPKHKDLLYRRDENGMILAERAIEQERPDVLRKILHVDPLLAWTSLMVLVYFILTSDENMLELIMIVYKCRVPHIQPAILEGLVEKIPTLAENGCTVIICNILDAGSSNCSSGFAPGKNTYLKAFLNFDMLGSLLLDKSRPCNGSRVIPEASSSPSALNMYHKGVLEDDKKRIQLNIVRVLLPWLSSFEVLNALVDMDLSSGEEGEGSNVIPQHLKPFQCQSLQSSIEAAWYSWARTIFLRRALCYVLYMVCIISLEWTTTITWLRVSVIAAICIKWGYFARTEVHQLKDKKSVFQYLSTFWNKWQISSLFLVLIYVCLNIVDIVISDSTRTTIFSQHEWFTGLVHLFTLINFLYYLRGIQKTSWILYALGVLIKKMSYFLFILIWILVSASSQLAKVNGAFDSKEPIHIFTETYVTAIFGAFDSAEFCSDPHIEASSRVVLILFIILTLIFMIFMNAMIAFISEAFANILDYQKAILAREMACLIVDLYNSMSAEDKMIIEENYKWVYKLVKQTDLNKIASGDTESDGDGRRATKQDVQSAVAKVRKRLERMEKQNDDVKSSIDVIKKESGEIKKENAELKLSLERMENENKLALETIISLIGASTTT